MEIINAVIHILDKDSGNIVLSQDVLDLENEITLNYVTKIINRIDSTDYKEIYINKGSKVHSLTELNNDFLEESKKLALDFFESIKKFEKISSGDLLIFNYKDSKNRLVNGLIKLDYSIKYSHNIDYRNDVLTNNIIQNKSILPSPSQTIHDAILLSDHKCKIIEKEYVEEQGKWLLSKTFFELENTSISVKDNIKIIKKSVQNISEKYDDNAFTVNRDMQKALHESIEMDSTIDNEYIAEAVFQENISAKKEFLEELKNKGLDETIRVPNKKIFEKKYQKQKIKLDNGIEISVPINLLKDKDVVEFKTNEDGTTSIVFKNIERLNNNIS